MDKKFLAIPIVIALAISACSFLTINTNQVVGSGTVTSETRSLTGFSAIVLESSADVHVAFGETEAVVVEAEDNLLPLIQTKVENNQLVISSKPLAGFTATKLIRINVTMKSLDSVTLSGSGNLTAPDLNANSFKVSMPGSGNITISGTSKNVDITLAGSGNIYCDALKANAAKVVLTGSGNITVNASDSLDASLSGSGDIRYTGNPAKLNKNVTGSGTIHP